MLDPALEPAIRQAEATLSACLSAQNLIWQTAFASAVSQLPETTRSLLATVRTNAAQGAPVEYKVVTRTSEGWSTLQKALQNARTRTACGLAPAPDKAATIAAAAVDPSVSAARQRLENSLNAVLVVWSAASQP
jgi:hypothetical protein